MFTKAATSSVSPVAEPDVGLSESHKALSLTVQLIVPDPQFQMLRFLLAGFEPPSVAEKENVDGEIQSALVSELTNLTASKASL